MTIRRRDAGASLWGLCVCAAVLSAQRPYYRPPPDPLLPKVEAAVARINNGERAAGIADLQTLLRKHPNHRQVLESLAQVYLQERRRGDATDLLVRCIKKHAGSWRCRTLRARMLLDTDDLLGAENLLEQAIQANSADAESHFYMGVLRMRQGQLERAEIALNYALAYRKAGALAAVHLHLASLFDRQKRPAEAAQQLEWYLRENPSVANAEQLRSRITELRAGSEIP